MISRSDAELIDSLRESQRKNEAELKLADETIGRLRQAGERMAEALEEMNMLPAETAAWRKAAGGRKD